MFNLIFYFIYNQQIEKGKSEGFARYNGSLIVWLSLLFYILLILTILKKYVGITVDLKFLRKDRLEAWIFYFLCIALVYRYYTFDKIEKIKNKYSEIEWIKYYGGFVIACLVFIPVVLIAIILS